MGGESDKTYLDRIYHSKDASNLDDFFKKNTLLQKRDLGKEVAKKSEQEENLLNDSLKKPKKISNEL